MHENRVARLRSFRRRGNRFERLVLRPGPASLAFGFCWLTTSVAASVNSVQSGATSVNAIKILLKRELIFLTAKYLQTALRFGPRLLRAARFNES